MLWPVAAPAQTIVDRLFGASTSTAIKAPVKCATTGPITLSGAQTIDGVSVTDHLNDSTGLPPDRVLVKNQADQTTNGVYVVSSTGAWVLAGDWQGAYNAASGTIIIVNSGTQAGFWQLTTLDPVVIAPAVGNGSNITFALYTPSVGTAAQATTVGTTASSTNASYYITGVASASSGYQAEVINSAVSFNASTGAVTATKFSGTNAALTGTTTTQNLTVLGTCTGCSGTTSLSLSGIVAATTSSSIDNSNYAQTWAWNTLGANTALTLSTTNGTTGSLLALSETTTGTGKALSSTLTGTSNTGYAGYFVNPSTSGYAVYASGAVNITGALTGVNAALSGTLTATTINAANAALSGTATVNNLTVSGTCTNCGGGDYKLLSFVNASGAAQVVFNASVLTGYKEYMILYDSLQGVENNDDNMELLVSTDNGSSYKSAYLNDSGGVTSYVDFLAGNVVHGTGWTFPHTYQGRIYFSNPGSTTTATIFDCYVSGYTGTNTIGSTSFVKGNRAGGFAGTGAAINNVKIIAAGGSANTFSGNFYLLGSRSP